VQLGAGSGAQCVSALASRLEHGPPEALPACLPAPQCPSMAPHQPQPAPCAAGQPASQPARQCPAWRPPDDGVVAGAGTPEGPLGLLQRLLLLGRHAVKHLVVELQLTAPAGCEGREASAGRFSWTRVQCLHTEHARTLSGLCAAWRWGSWGVAASSSMRARMQQAAAGRSG
jgi:hypothetical protein